MIEPGRGVGRVLLALPAPVLEVQKPFTGGKQVGIVRDLSERAGSLVDFNDNFIIAKSRVGACFRPIEDPGKTQPPDFLVLVLRPRSVQGGERGAGGFQRLTT